MHQAFHRERHGQVFLTILSDGQEIPWRPLTIGEFIEYDKLLKGNTYPQAYIENEIFIKCVKNKALIELIDELPAGTISQVTETILQYSGPSSLEELQYFLDFNRTQVQGVLQQIISYISQAFPAYRPEDIYKMDYHLLMTRFAEAENKLMRLGMIATPISFTPIEPLEAQKSKPPEKKKTDDLLQKFYEQEGIKDPKLKKSPSQVQPAYKQPSQTIITTDDMNEHTMAYTGHEIEDRELLEGSMVKDTAPIYKDYLEQIKKDGKITPKSTEQRKQEALERSRRYQAHLMKLKVQPAPVEKLVQPKKKKIVRGSGGRRR